MNNKYVKAIVNLVIALIVLLLFVFLVPKILVFFMPFLVGWIIAMIASPLVRFFEDKLRIKRKAGTVVVIVAVIAGVILIGYTAGTKLVEETIGFIGSLPQLWNSLEADLISVGENLDVIYKKFPLNIQEGISNIGNNAETYIGDVVSRIGTPTVTAVGNFARNLPSVIISIIMSLLSAYFFVAEKEKVIETCKTITPQSILDKWNILIDSLRTAVGGYFKAQLKIECWIYILLLIGLMLLDINYAFLIAFGIAILDILPFFGTGAVMIPWALVKFLSGDYKMTIGLLIIWGVGQLVRQIIQPKIVGDSIGAEPIPTLFMLFIGYKIAGVIGMIIAVPIGLMVINLYKAGVFDTVKTSVKILVTGINRFRKLDGEDEKL